MTITIPVETLQKHQADLRAWYKDKSRANGLFTHANMLRFERMLDPHQPRAELDEWSAHYDSQHPFPVLIPAL